LVYKSLEYNGKAEYAVKLLQKKDHTAFTTICSEQYCLATMVVTFLAILEMLKRAAD